MSGESIEKKVSIIVPVYNAEKYIQNCVESLCNQLYQNIEIILVDDGSKDESAKICDKMANNDSRVNVIHKENGGVSSARNVGIKVATGYYIMFADSDDMADKFWVKRMVELAEIWGVNFVICTYRWCQTAKEAMIPINHEKPFEPVWASTKEEFYNELGYMMAHRETMFAPWNKLYVASIVKENGLNFPEDMSYGEDFLFNIKYIQYINGVIETREQLYNYIVQNPNSLESVFKADLFENQTRLYQAAKDFMIANDVYRANNVEFLSYYYAKRVVASIINQLHEKNDKTGIETRKYIERIVRDEKAQDAISYVDLDETKEEKIITELVKARKYAEVYDAILGIENIVNNRESTVRYKVIPKTPSGLGLVTSVFSSIKKYGMIVTLNRIMRKIKRSV